MKSALNRFKTLIMFVTMSRHVFFCLISSFSLDLVEDSAWQTLTWEITDYELYLADTGSLSGLMYSQDLTWCLPSSRSSRNTCWCKNTVVLWMRTCLSQAGRGKERALCPSSALNTFFHLSLLQCHYPGYIILGPWTKAFPKCEFCTWSCCSHPFSQRSPQCRLPHGLISQEDVWPEIH